MMCQRALWDKVKFLQILWGGGNSMSVTICAKWRNCFVLKMELLLFIGGRVGFIRGF